MNTQNDLGKSRYGQQDFERLTGQRREAKDRNATRQTFRARLELGCCFDEALMNAGPAGLTFLSDIVEQGTPQHCLPLVS